MEEKTVVKKKTLWNKDNIICERTGKEKQIQEFGTVAGLP